MAALSPQEKLERLKAEKKRIEQRMKREAAKIGADKRKRDNRRKYIAGGALISAIESGDQQARMLLDRLLTDPGDRDLLADLLPGQFADAFSLPE